MLVITELATEKIKEYLADNKQSGPVRVAMMRGCGGPSLGLALDDAKPTDTVVELDGLTMLMDASLLSSCGRTTVDFKPPSGCGCGGGGFTIDTSTPLPGSGSGGGCGCGSGGGCSSGSCNC